MTAENNLYAIAGGVAASLLTTLSCCLVFYRTEPKRDATASEALRDVLNKQEARRHMNFHELAEDADREAMRIMRTWK